MTTYFTAVWNDLLPAIQSAERMPATLRLKRIVGPILPPFPGDMTLVELEDDEADAVFYEGRTVTPTIRAHYDDEGALTHTTVIDRTIDNTVYQVAS